MLSDLYIEDVDMELLREQWLALIDLTKSGAIAEGSVLWGLIQMLGDYVGEA